MEAFYKIIATGIAPERQHQTVHDDLQKMLRVAPDAFDKTFQRLAAGQMVTLVKGLSEAQAQVTVRKLTAVGLLCTAESMGLSLVSKTYRCPACGYEQDHHGDGTPDVCSNCGVVVDSYTPPPVVRRNELQELMERERRALAAQSKVVDEQEMQEAERKRAAKLRKIARRKVEAELGLSWYKKLLAPKVSIPVLTFVLAGGGVGGWLWWDQQQQAQAAAAAAASAAAANQTGAAGTQLTIAPPPGLSVNVAANPSTGVSDPAIDGAVSAAESTASMGSGRSQAAAPFTVAVPTAAALRGGANATDPAVLAVKSDPRVLTSLAFYRLDSGDLGTAAKLLDRVTLRLNDKTTAPTAAAPDQLQRDAAQLRAALAGQFAQRNDLDSAQSQWKRANRIAEAISAAAPQALAYGSLGRINHAYPALAAAKDYFQLATTAAGRTAATPLLQVEVLSTLARELTQAGRAPAARELFNQATAATRQIQERSAQVTAQALLAQRFAEAGDLGAATTALAAAADPAPLAQRVTAVAALGLALAQRGDTAQAQIDFNAAIAQAGALPDAVERSETFIFIARQLVQAGNSAAAEQIIAALGQ
jgi:tetratricopeptide (TPR) repeat protein